ncbi:MAG: hypothetical protein KKD39_01340 [Candidatus Altiarchaeota archaeon]|nr:hypothetical protein [Candidatus Altiarchaeota archaeon]
MFPPEKLVGVAGLLVVSVGVLTKERKKQNILYIIGGLLLELYSILLKDPIFIVLQLVFTLSAAYDLIKNKGVDPKPPKG